MNHVEKAVEYYNNNFNCSQGVFTSFATEMGMDEKLREDIFSHPTIKFLQAWKENGIDNLLTVLVMRKCEAVMWTMETNFEPKKAISICNG